MAREPRRRGLPANKGRVERLMRDNGIRTRHKRRYKATTDSRHTLPVAPNPLNRDFQPAVPNQAWCADLTYISTAEGWLYLAIVLDLFNREIVGWSIQHRMTADIVINALTMAWRRRKPMPGLRTCIQLAADLRNRVWIWAISTMTSAESGGIS